MEQDLTTVYGFCYAVVLVASVVPGGLVWFAPECKTWLSFVSRMTNKRTVFNSFEGDCERDDVRNANTAIRCVAFLIRLATARGVRVLVENPPQSLLWKYPPLVRAMVASNAVMHNTFGGGFGWTSQKPLSLFSTLPVELVRRYLCVSRRFANSRLDQLRASGVEAGGLIQKKVSSRGKISKEGNKLRIKQSEAYPAEFGDAVATVLLHMFRSRASL